MLSAYEATQPSRDLGHSSTPGYGRNTFNRTSRLRLLASRHSAARWRKLEGWFRIESAGSSAIVPVTSAKVGADCALNVPRRCRCCRCAAFRKPVIKRY